MNNKEILKRFKFDLGLDTFKKYKYFIYFYTDSYSIIKNIARIVEKMKYNQVNEIPITTTNDTIFYFIMNTEHKLYQIMTNHDLVTDSRNIDLYFNPIPNYINDYTIEEGDRL